MPTFLFFSFGDSRARGNAKRFRVDAARSLPYWAHARARATMSQQHTTNYFQGYISVILLNYIEKE